MFWFFFWFRHSPQILNDGSRQPANFSFSHIVTALSTLMFTALGGVAMFAIVLFFIFFPNTGSFDDFYPSGTVNCYLSHASNTEGYTLTLITEEDATILTTPLTKARFQEMDYICRNEPSTLYCLNTYHTGTGVFISTYDDQTTEEAWKDYKAATQQSSINKNTVVIVASMILGLLCLLFFIVLLIKLIKEIRNHRSAKAIAASAAAMQSEIPAPQGADSTSGIVPSATGSIGLPQISPTFDDPSKETASVSEAAAPAVSAASSDPLLKDDLADEIDAFDPGNASWHK